MYLDVPPLISSVVHLFCLLHPPSLSLSVKWGGGVRWQRADVSSPALKMLVKMEGRNSGKGKACLSVEVGRFYEGGHNHKQQIQALCPGSSFGNGSSLSNLRLQPQTLNVELTPHLVEAAFNPLWQHGSQCFILQQVCLIKLNFACTRGVHSPYLHRKLQSSAKCICMF